MSVFRRFVGWINQNLQQQPLKDESKRSENVDSNSATENDTNKRAFYYDKAEAKKQGKLWRAAEKKKPWYDAPPKVKVTTKKGLCHMHIELTVGLPPEGVYDLFANPNDFPFFRIDNETGRELLGRYMKEKMKFMKYFEGKWKIEPLYVDSERLCKDRKPKSREEYKRCSGGEGKVASKVTMDQYFQPYFLLNLPPLSWYIRGITIKTTKNLLILIQNASIMFRDA
ncbi:hypothetical protein (Domain of unknown function DUF220) [Arabidopsis thaliana]|uniref:DUF220 domain-containing protein n=1 Tax=Arabidopsis thaliana TaxID=3702 RepID=F4I6A3_ARATH|nr:hypothetical protein (Domain of unknown function DUF220) [Arabidopsis thaliana]AEE30421.1 hypothetical protein (Domain of unknown function DUF220) [Arabidopsis thaliana]|eukprot:NP_001185073.1 hypothetical protein (Domain of unknown function DUF220) [Arabidopsis thaliana]